MKISNDVRAPIAVADHTDPEAVLAMSRAEVLLIGKFEPESMLKLVAIFSTFRRMDS